MSVPIQTMTDLTAMAWLLLALLSDVAYRRIPAWLCGAAFVLCVAAGHLGWLTWSWIGMALAVVIISFAGLPPGDVMAACVLGGLMGMLGIAVTLAVALALGFAMFRLYDQTWLDWPGEFPFFASVAAGACVTFLIR